MNIFITSFISSPEKSPAINVETIIDNNTLGYNIITFGSIIIIIQAAVPTFANYFGIVVIISMLSYFTGFFKKLTDNIDNTIRKHFGKEEKEIEIVLPYDDKGSNEKLNSLDFIFMTSNFLNLCYNFIFIKSTIYLILSFLFKSTYRTTF